MRPRASVVDCPTLYMTITTADSTGGYVVRCTTADGLTDSSVLATGLADPFI
jgi:hypothetical protein